MDKPGRDAKPEQTFFITVTTCALTIVNGHTDFAMTRAHYSAR
jgi:hypothetical protein